MASPRRRSSCRPAANGICFDAGLPIKAPGAAITISTPAARRPTTITGKGADLAAATGHPAQAVDLRAVARGLVRGGTAVLFAVLFVAGDHRFCPSMCFQG